MSDSVMSKPGICLNLSRAQPGHLFVHLFDRSKLIPYMIHNNDDKHEEHFLDHFLSYQKKTAIHLT